jgi:streptomycin 6-kinase
MTRLPFDLPHGVVAFTRSARGEDGAQWLTRLPQLIRQSESRFHVSVLHPIEGGSQNCVLRCKGPDDRTSVLKIGFRETTIAYEAAALTAWKHRVPRVIDYEPRLGAFLLEEVVTGTPPADTPTSAEAGMIIRELHAGAPTDAEVPTLEERQRDNLERLQGQTVLGVTDVEIDEARDLLDGLLSSTKQEALLHGDFRPGNLLYDAKRGWILIDPEPQIGDAYYDFGLWATWTLPSESEPRRYLREVSTAAGMDFERVAGWFRLTALRQAYLAAKTGDAAREKRLTEVFRNA